MKKLLSSVSDSERCHSHPFIWLLCSFQGPRRGATPRTFSPGQMVLELPAESRSLKTQQHAAVPGTGAGAPTRTAFPGPVDMLVPDRCWFVDAEEKLEGEL